MTDLKRALGIPGAVLMGLGSIVGTGVFISLGLVVEQTGSAILLAIVLAGLLALCNGLSSAQLAANYPVSGGTYEYAYRLIDARVGFTAGWVFLLAKSASAATAALGISGYVLHLGGLDHPTLRTFAALWVTLALATVVSRGISRSNWVNIAMVLFTLLSLGGLVAMALPVWIARGAPHMTPLLPQAGGGNFLLGVALAFVAFTGYGRIATLGEEVKRPRITIPRAMIAGLVAIIILYAAVATAAVGILGVQPFSALTRETAAPLSVVAEAMQQPVLAWLVTAGAVTAMMSVLLNLILGLSRVLLAMARRHDMPTALAHIDSRFASPNRAVWAITAVTCLLILSGSLQFTWSFSAFTVLIYYALTNWAALKLLKGQRLFPVWISILGLVGCAFLAFFVPLRIAILGLCLIGLGWFWQEIMQRQHRIASR